MNHPALPRGLYAITDSTLSGTQMVEHVARAISGGAVMVQYRDKGDDADRRLWAANDLQVLCRSLQVPLIINDDVELAQRCKADGVHLGAEDASIEHARATLGEQAIIGVSCYASLARAREAQTRGASYVAFGSFYPSPTKPGAPRAELDMLRSARATLSVPIAAIGGITPDNAPTLINAGADLLAVVTGVFGAQDVSAAARAYAVLFA